MPEFCTCGAQLPPDALFCHKCGKPQRELIAPEFQIPENAESALPPAPVPLAPDALPMNFRNRVAVLFTAFAIVFNVSGGIEMLQSQFRNASDPKVQEALQTLRSGSGVAIFLIQLFLFITCLSMIGGALGAKLIGRASRPPGGGNIV